MDSPLPDFINNILETGRVEGSIGKIDLVQTHISYLLMTAGKVYKIKKPVNFGFLNFSTLEHRKYYCDQELFLNRRLCPDIYLDVIALTREGDSFYLGEERGEVVDWAVKMVRMPEDRMMTNLLKRGLFKKQMLDRIVTILVPFYEEQIPDRDLKSFGSIRAVKVKVENNLEQVRPFVDKGSLTMEQFNRIGAYVVNFLKKEELFRERSRNKVRDCHGDLYSANICIDEKVHIFDCIEFNENFRIIDLASDVAFLAMDLDYHGLNDFSDYFINSFIKACGDRTLGEVLDFYKCYRAVVRGKIGLLTAESSQISEEVRDESLQKAKKYFELALSYVS